MSCSCRVALAPPIHLNRQHLQIIVPQRYPYEIQ